MKKLISFLERSGTVRGFQIFQVLRFFTILVTGILLSKTNLNIRDIGCYESLIFLSGAVSFFWVSGLMNSLLANYSRSEDEGNRVFIFTTFVSIFLINTLLVLLLILFQDSAKQLLPAEAIDFYPLLLIYIFFNNPTFLIENILLLKKKTFYLIVYGIFNMLAFVAAVIIPVENGAGLHVSFYNLIALSIIKNIILLNLLSKHSTIQLDFKSTVEFILNSLPLVISLLISGSAEYVDGLLVSTHFGSDAFAIFRYGAKELPLAVLLSGALSNAFVPKLAASKFDKENLAALKKESLHLMHLLFPLSILLILTSHYFYPFIFRAEFLSSATIFNTYLLLLISRVVFPQSIVIAAGKTNVIFKIALIEITVNVIASYLLMLRFGIIGIAIGTLMAFFTEKLCLAFYVRQKLEIKVSDYLSIRTWILYSVILIVVYISNYLLTLH